MDKHRIILVVEDEKPLQEAILTKLSSMGVQGVAFESGTDALEYLQKQSPKPDAIWLDYYIKDINGIEFMTEMKKDPAIANIPVIVVSNSASPEKVQKMLDLGVKKYLLKAEHKLEEIVKIIFELIGEKSL